MVAHLVLCELRSDLSADERKRFTDALGTALRSIPVIRRSTIGQRMRLGFAYEGQAPAYEYAALIEFDDEAGLRAYLGHPAHAELAALFWSCCARTLVSDYQLAGTLNDATDRAGR